MPLERKYTDKELIDLLEECSGNKAAVARALGIRRAYVDDLINTRPDVKAFYDDIREAFIDKAEENIFTAVANGDKGLSQYVVATLGKNRGWAGRQELTGKDGEDLGPPTIIYQQYADTKPDGEADEASSGEG